MRHITVGARKRRGQSPKWGQVELHKLLSIGPSGIGARRDPNLMIENERFCFIINANKKQSPNAFELIKAKGDFLCLEWREAHSCTTVVMRM